LPFETIPAPVVDRAEELCLDWVGSALAGKGARAVDAIERLAVAMGPADGPSEVLISRRRTSPLFAALVNGAAWSGKVAFAEAGVTPADIQRRSEL
jgi:2-methylcitrate dehydratase PrpD